MPVFTNIWQYISTTSDYASLASFIKTAEPDFMKSLMDPLSPITLLAPNNQVRRRHGIQAPSAPRQPRPI